MLMRGAFCLTETHAQVILKWCITLPNVITRLTASRLYCSSPLHGGLNPTQAFAHSPPPGLKLTQAPDV